jgi:hypothetical protein
LFAQSAASVKRAVGMRRRPVLCDQAIEAMTAI